MTDRSNDPAGPAVGPESFGPGVDDLVIVPLVVVAFAIWRILRRTFFILIDIIDFLFPILLQVMRFPLFTLRILGDGIAALLKGIVRFLPVGGDRRTAWREFISQHWAWLRQKFSYKAFEQWLHHAFENGMAWVFKTCRAMTPRTAFIVLIGAVLWLPISFTIATVDARGADREGTVPARLDAAPASGRDRDRQDQAAGAAGLSGGVAAGEAASGHAGADPVLELSRGALPRAQERLPLSADRNGCRRASATRCGTPRRRRA